MVVQWWRSNYFNNNPNIALKALEKGIKSGDFAFIKLFLEYRFGKPKRKLI